MAWALVNTKEVSLDIGNWQGDNLSQTYMKQTITAAIGTICSLIVYDGIAEYTPPEGYKLVEVPEDAKVSDAGY